MRILGLFGAVGIDSLAAVSSARVSVQALVASEMLSCRAFVAGHRSSRHTRRSCPPC